MWIAADFHYRYVHLPGAACAYACCPYVKYESYTLLEVSLYQFTSLHIGPCGGTNKHTLTLDRLLIAQQRSDPRQV